MRKSFDGLCGLIMNEMGLNAMDGNVYLFINRRRDRMKMLIWESGGFMLYYKRLEQGTFDLPCRGWGKNGESVLKVSWEVLVLMISGIKGRGMHDPWMLLSGYEGCLLCDGYPVYDKCICSVAYF